MKKISIILFLTAISLGVFAQEKTDTTLIKFGDKTILIIESSDIAKDSIIIEADSASTPKRRKFNGHWAGVEFGINNYRNKNSELPNDLTELDFSKSLSLGLNFSEFNIGLCRDYIGLVTGFGLRWNNYRFENNVRLNNDSIPSIFYKDDNTNFDKVKLMVGSLTIPLLIEFQIPMDKKIKKKRLYIATGVIGNLRIKSHAKYVYSKDGQKQKEKFHNDYNLAPFGYAITARIGYRGLKLYANYHMSTLFKNNEGPELYPFEAGISLLNF